MTWPYNWPVRLSTTQDPESPGRSRASSLMSAELYCSISLLMDIIPERSMVTQKVLMKLVEPGRRKSDG